MVLSPPEFYEGWSDQIGSRVDDILSGAVESILGEDVFARIAQHLDAREQFWSARIPPVAAVAHDPK